MAKSLIQLIKAKGFEVSKQKTKLWSEPEMIKENLAIDSVESIRVSKKYEDSIFAIVRDGDESKLIPFAKDELVIDDLVYDEDTGIVDPEESGLEDSKLSLGLVTAMREDKELGIDKGETALKFYVD